MRRFLQYAVILLSGIWSVCLAAGVANSADTDVRLLSPHSGRIERFLGTRPGDFVDIARISIKKERYLLVADRPHRKAVVLRVEQSGTNRVQEATGPGFFLKKPSGIWQRDNREEFEMEGGIWMLDRYLQVLKKSDRAKFSRFEWRNHSPANIGGVKPLLRSCLDPGPQELLAEPGWYRLRTMPAAASDDN